MDKLLGESGAVERAPTMFLLWMLSLLSEESLYDRPLGDYHRGVSLRAHLSVYPDPYTTPEEAHSQETPNKEKYRTWLKRERKTQK